MSLRLHTGGGDKVRLLLSGESLQMATSFGQAEKPRCLCLWLLTGSPLGTSWQASVFYCLPETHFTSLCETIAALFKDRVISSERWWELVFWVKTCSALLCSVTKLLISLLEPPKGNSSPSVCVPSSVIFDGVWSVIIRFTKLIWKMAVYRLWLVLGASLPWILGRSFVFAFQWQPKVVLWHKAV